MAAESDSPAEESSGATERWCGIYTDVLEDLHDVLNERALTAYKAHRKIEMETTFEGRAALNNLVDVLAHVATLLQKAESLSHREQAAHIVNIEDHLRRAVMEGQEEVVNDLLDEVASRWDDYIRVAGPLREEGLLLNAPSHRKLEKFRSEIAELLDIGRGTKPDAAWDDHLTGAGYFKKAAELAQELLDGMNQCIGAAEQITEQRSHASRSIRWNAASVAVGVLGLLFGIAVLVLH